MQNTAIIAVAIGDIVLVSLSQVALWQRKEYRWDRMQAYIGSPEGSFKKQVWLFIAGLLVGAGWATALWGSWQLAEYAGIASLLVILVFHLIRIRRKGVMRPIFTARAIMIVMSIVLVYIAWAVFVIIPGALFALQLATLVFFLPIIITSVVLASSIVAMLQKRSVIAQAKRLRANLQGLTVVGITGSVGKTSTKTYLLHILDRISETISATTEHRNSSYVVAKDMLFNLTKKTAIYIAEMAAYKKGEIMELAELVQPTVAVITAITNQHVALFGSLENLASAKWELIDALPDDGVAVLNADDERIVRKSKGLNKKTVWFSMQKKTDVYLKNNILGIGDEMYEIHVPIVSQGQKKSALAAAAAAHALGISGNQIAQKLATLPALPQTMEIKTSKALSRIIDDSYSASEASVMNAIEYIQSLPAGDLRIAMLPIIELGSEGSRVHENIGKAMAQLSARVYIYGDAYKEDIQKGLGESSKATVRWFDDANAMADEVTADISSHTTIVLEGRVPSLVRNAVI